MWLCGLFDIKECEVPTMYSVLCVNNYHYSHLPAVVERSRYLDSCHGRCKYEMFVILLEFPSPKWRSRKKRIADISYKKGTREVLFEIKSALKSKHLLTVYFYFIMISLILEVSENNAPLSRCRGDQCRVYFGQCSRVVCARADCDVTSRVCGRARFVALPPELGGKHKCTIVSVFMTFQHRNSETCRYTEREMLEEFFEKTQEKLFRLPVLTSSLPVSALMWRYCLSGDPYRSGEYCSAVITAGMNH